MEAYHRAPAHRGGADLDRVFRIEVKTEEFDGLALSLPADFALLEEAISDKQAAVLLIDPLMRTMPADRDASKPQDARLTLEPLSGVADRTNCTIIGNCHFNKSGQTDPVFRILGSIEIQNVARAIIRFASKDGTSVMSCGKNTHGPVWPSLEYVIEEAEFTRDGKTFVTSRFVLGEETDVSADDFLRAEGKSGGVTGTGRMMLPSGYPGIWASTATKSRQRTRSLPLTRKVITNACYGALSRRLAATRRGLGSVRRATMSGICLTRISKESVAAMMKMTSYAP